MKPFKTKFTKILTGLGVTAALLLSIPSPAVSQEALPGKGEVVLEKAGEIELGDLIQQWASEMDHVTPRPASKQKTRTKRFSKDWALTTKRLFVM